MLVGVKTVATAYPGSAGHVARYLDNVMHAIRHVQTDTRFVVFTTPENHDAYEGWMRVPVPPPSTSLRGLIGRTDGLEGPLRQAKPDVLLAPLADPHPGGGVPQVLYALDIAAWEKDALPPSDEVADVRTIRKAIASARSLIVTSEYLRRRCLEVFEAPLNKTVVAPCGVNPVFQQPSRSIVEEPYIVIFADALAFPVLHLVNKMIEHIRDEYPHSFVVVGPAHSGQHEPWDDQVVRIEKLPDSSLAGLYQHAALFLNPGVHDGAALRTIEALYCGVPVVCAKSGATVELVGQTPVYYNPMSPESMVQSMRRILDADEKERADRINFGRQAVTRYRWEDTAWKVLGAFKKR